MKSASLLGMLGFLRQQQQFSCCELRVLTCGSDSDYGLLVMLPGGRFFIEANTLNICTTPRKLFEW